MKFPIVRITWVDSTVHGGWQDLDYYISREPFPAESVGYEVKRNRTCTVLVQNLGRGVVGESTTIPAGCIKSREVLKTATWPL